MSRTQHDRDLVAKNEYSYIAKTYKIPIARVRIAALTVSKTTRPSISRKMIYWQLREMGHIIKTKKYQ